MTIEEVTVDDLAEAIERGVRVVDVREPGEYVAGHVPGAVLVPLGTVPDNVDAFRGDGPVYVVCQGGGRSMRACEYLADHDIVAVNVAGGTRAWQLAGREVVAGDQPS